MVTVRRFEQGFTTDFFALQKWCESHGYQFVRDKSWFVVRKMNEKGRPKRLSWENALLAIDNVRIELGLDPIRRAG